MDEGKLSVPIPSNHASRHAYHFSHIDNLPGLLQHGLLANNHPSFPQHNHRSIAAASIQERRSKMLVPCGPGGYVHDYVPLYFGARSPMLLSVIQSKNVDQSDILYFEFPIALIDRPDTVFTDASANTSIPPGFYENSTDLSKLDWAAIDSPKWGNVDDGFRHRRMAELLVRSCVPLNEAVRCVVWNEETKIRVEKIVKGRSFPPITFEHPSRRHWFTDFPNGKQSSLVVGPREIAGTYAAACAIISDSRNKDPDTAAFVDLASLLDGLRADFSVLPQTAELVGLRSENGIHRSTVDIHTMEVVAKLLTLTEYHLLDQEAQVLVEIAAYLHDIGKGPRSRWNTNGGLQKVDPNHPVGAMPMIVEIFTRHVAEISQDAAEIVAKLVCYHDLVGDVLGKGRAAHQIVDTAISERELDMLFALGKADATVLNENW